MRSRKTLALLSVGAALLFCVSLAAAQGSNTGVPVPPASPGIVFDLSPGTGAPPSTLGGFTMTPVPPGAPACTQIQPPGPIPTPGGSIVVAPWVDQRCIGAGWSTWSHGYAGDVYYTGGGTSQVITLPPGTGAFYLYVEPDPFALHNFEVVADGVSSGVFEVHGSSGARYVGVYDDGGGSISSITINCTSGVGFASGEYGWAAAAGGPIWGRAYETLFESSNDLEMMRAYRDEVLSKTDEGAKYKDLLYKSSEEALEVLLDNPELMAQAKVLIEANRDAVSDVLDGHEGIIYNTDEIVAFLGAYATEAPPVLKALAKLVKWDMLRKQRRGELFFGFRLE